MVVYKHTNTWGDGKVYIGQTKGRTPRGTNIGDKVNYSYKGNKKLLAAVNGDQAAWDGLWKHQVLATFDNEKATDIAETYYIILNDAVNSGYNNNYGRGLKPVFGRYLRELL